jgi:hypothetical protein
MTSIRRWLGVRERSSSGSHGALRVAAGQGARQKGSERSNSVRQARSALAVALPLGYGLLLACQSPALVRTARTLPEGGSDISLSLNLTRVSLREEVIGGAPIPLSDFNLPNPIPDVSYDYGLTDDLELGARLSLGSGLIEARTKLRFIEAANGTLHVALAPAAGYRVLALVNGPVLTLPLIVTYDLSPGMSLSGGPVMSYASYSVPESFDTGDLDLAGDTLYAGGGLGIEFRPALGLHVMPAVEVQRSVSRRGDVENLPVIDMLFFGVTLGWGSRREHDREPSVLPDRNPLSDPEAPSLLPEPPPVDPGVPLDPEEPGVPEPE